MAKPGQQLSSRLPTPGSEVPFADPERIHDDITGLLSRLDVVAAPDTLPERTHLLERAHDLLVDALATVDKI